MRRFCLYLFPAVHPGDLLCHVGLAATWAWHLQHRKKLRAHAHAHAFDKGDSLSCAPDRAGIAGIRTTGSSAPSRAASGSTFTDSFVKVDYPSYPVLAPTPASHHAHHQQQASYSAPDSGSYGLMFGGSAYSATQGGPQQQQQPQRQEAPAYGYSQQGSQQPQQAYQGFSSHQSSHQLQPQQQEQQHQGTPQYAGYSSTPEPTLQDGQGYGSGAAYSYQQQPQPHQQQQHQAAPGMGAPAMQQAQSWQQLCADNGQPYYYNSSTGITQWEQPAGFV